MSEYGCQSQTGLIEKEQFMTQDPNTAGQPAGAAPQPSSLGYMPPTGGGYAGPTPTKDEQTMAMLCYILGIITWFIGPLIIWLIKKDQSKFVDDQGKEVLNWEITLTICWVCLFVLGIVLHIIPILGAILVILLELALFVCAIVFGIMGAVKANQGIAYRFPFALRLIK